MAADFVVEKAHVVSGHHVAKPTAVANSWKDCPAMESQDTLVASTKKSSKTQQLSSLQHLGKAAVVVSTATDGLLFEKFKTAMIPMVILCGITEDTCR